MFLTMDLSCNSGLDPETTLWSKYEHMAWTWQQKPHPECDHASPSELFCFGEVEYFH